MLSGPSAPARQPQCVALCLRGTLLHCTGASKALLHVAARLLLGPAVVARLGHVLPLVACPWHAACSILGQRAHKYTSVGWMVAWLPSGLRRPLYTCEVASVSRPHVLARFDRLQRALRSSPEAFASPARALSHSGMPTLATHASNKECRRLAFSAATGARRVDDERRAVSGGMTEARRVAGDHSCTLPVRQRRAAERVWACYFAPE